MDKHIDFLSIGDITTDAFIRIKDAAVTCDINHEHCQLCIDFGAKIPYEFVEVVRAVGNSANASVSAARLGISAGLLSYIGDDRDGRECLEELNRNAVNTSLIQVESGKKTNYHYVLWYEEERTILVKHEDFTYRLPEFQKPKWLYLSSLSENSLAFHDEIGAYLERNREVKLAFQPGTFQMKLGLERLRSIYEHTEIFFCNKEEAGLILGKPDATIKELLQLMREEGPRIVIITDGPKGAFTYDGTQFLTIPAYPDPKPPVERTGAGDAFASTITTALVLGEPLEKALLWGPINSMSVVQHIGAQKGLLSKEVLVNYLASAPSTYQVSTF